MSARTLLGLLLLLAVVARPGEGLRCWVCSSTTSENCRDPFNSSRVDLVDCDRQRSHGSLDKAYCQKEVMTINEGQSRVVRKCVFSRKPLEENCAEPNTMAFINREHCSTCETDQCNAAPGGSAAPIASLATALLLAWRRLHTLSSTT